jgi:hypothetical protein
MTAKIITSMTGLLEAIRTRQDELDLSCELIDEIAGLPARYTSKLLAPVPLRGISHMSLTAILGALGIGLLSSRTSPNAKKSRIGGSPGSASPSVNFRVRC